MECQNGQNRPSPATGYLFHRLCGDRLSKKDWPLSAKLSVARAAALLPRAIFRATPQFGVESSLWLEIGAQPRHFNNDIQGHCLFPGLVSTSGEADAGLRCWSL